jgi:hypothetical protein
MQSHLDLLAAALCLVCATHAYGDEYPVASNLAQLETNSDKATQNSLAQSKSTTESRHEQEDDSDDCN